MAGHDNLSALSKRLTKLESTALAPRHQSVRQFAIEGPVNMPIDASIEFLRECGHDVRDEDLNIVRVFVAPDRDLPLRDVTERYGR